MVINHVPAEGLMKVWLFADFAHSFVGAIIECVVFHCFLVVEEFIAFSTPVFPNPPVFFVDVISISLEVFEMERALNTVIVVELAHFPHMRNCV